jgi:porphobilinogen synthase
MTAETVVRRDDLVMPLFVREGRTRRVPVKSMPGINQLPVSEAVLEAKLIRSLGIPAVLLFGVPVKKDVKGSQAYAENGIIQKAVRAIKAGVPDLLVITDTCLCEYTNHGHCGVVEKGDVHNDKTLDLIAGTAVSQAKAGADLVAPSGMMDGMVAAVRRGLDTHGFRNLPVMSYAVKYASAFYGPFREAAGSGASFKGDRKSHQMDPANVREALREAALDVSEGADILMVKPAMPYLDVIRRIKQVYPLPLAAYHVSGEYAMLKTAVDKGLLDRAAVLEALLSIKRAGADIIITYFAKEICKEL